MHQGRTGKRFTEEMPLAEKWFQGLETITRGNLRVQLDKWSYDVLAEQWAGHVDQMQVLVIDTGQSAGTVEAYAESPALQFDQER